MCVCLSGEALLIICHLYAGNIMEMNNVCAYQCVIMRCVCNYVPRSTEYVFMLVYVVLM